MKITQEEVTHVANLSKLKFSEQETEEFATTLTKIVDMVRCWKKWTRQEWPQRLPWQIVRPYCVRMLLKKGLTATVCLKCT